MAFGTTPATVSPRRRPKQSRSSVTVDAILEAAALLFARDDFDASSTTRIAERAGVSVGSLYEYFPNKDALVAKLLKRHCDRMIDVFAERFVAVKGQNLDVVMANFIQATYDTYATDVQLHRVLLEQMGRVSKPRHLKRVSETIVSLLEQALETCGASVRRPSVHAAAFLVESAVESITHRTLLYAPELFDSSLREELLVMTVEYLSAPARRPSLLFIHPAKEGLLGAVSPETGIKSSAASAENAAQESSY